MFPESDFDADEKFGKVIDSNNKQYNHFKKRIILFYILLMVIKDV
mgnify:CR=1 FL=1